jgi:hypothetical protein
MEVGGHVHPVAAAIAVAEAIAAKLAVLRRTKVRPRLVPMDRAFFTTTTTRRRFFRTTRRARSLGQLAADRRFAVPALFGVVLMAYGCANHSH